MAKRGKRLIQTHFDRLTVVVDEDQVSGGDVYRTDDLSRSARYRVLATTVHVWDDGSTAPVFLLEAPGGRIIERACEKFKVVEAEEGGS
jgi:hypothetical protein